MESGLLFQSILGTTTLGNYRLVNGNHGLILNFYTNSTRMQQMNGTSEESQQAVGIAKAKTTPENNDLIG